MAIFTVGHSKLEKEAFLALVSGLDVLVDVRSHPSSKWPLFVKESLETVLPAAGIQYLWEPDLGGWSERYPQRRDFAISHGVNFDAYAKGKFPKGQIAAQKEITDRPTWYNQGLFDYSVFMAIDEFIKAANYLIEIGKTANVAIMCCEATWWRCHRSMISDYLAYLGYDSTHLIRSGKKISSTSHAKVLSNRLERYEQFIKDKWETHKQCIVL